MLAARFGGAQTNVQLQLQLRELGFGADELALVARAYGTACELFSGCFRPSGRTFLAHLVGTASALADLRAPLPVVLAGLLHAAYTHGEFGDGMRGVRRRRRAALRAAVGTEAESLVELYTRAPPGAEALRASGLPSPGPGRDIVMVRLANQLDDYRDALGAEPRVAQRMRDLAESRGAAEAELADRLELPGLACALREVVAELLRAPSGGAVTPPPRRALDLSSPGYAYMLAPASHRLRARALLWHWVRRPGLAGLRRRLAPLRSWRR